MQVKVDIFLKKRYNKVSFEKSEGSVLKKSSSASRLWLTALVFAVAACVLGPYNLNGISPVVAVVLVAGALEPAGFGFLSVLAYLLVGLLLPVYPAGLSGLGILFGSYGGYLFALLLCPLAIAYAVRYLKKEFLLSLCIGFGAAWLLYFGIGSIWYLIASEKTLFDVLKMQGVPCLLFLADAFAAFLIVARLHGRRA